MLKYVALKAVSTKSDITSKPNAAQEEGNGDIAPAFNEDLTLHEMKASFKSNKGALTRLSNQVKVRAIKSPGSAAQLNESYNKFLAKCDFLYRAAHQLALKDEDNCAAWTAAQEQLHSLQETFERIYGDAQVQLGVGVPSPETGCLLYTSPSPRDRQKSRMPSSA